MPLKNRHVEFRRRLVQVIYAVAIEGKFVHVTFPAFAFLGIQYTGSVTRNVWKK
jgi:hypothetical protein